MNQFHRALPLVALVLTAAACSNSEVAKQRAFESGNAFFAAGKYNEAIVEYRNAVQQDERFGEARLRLAEALAKTGDAVASFRQYVRAADLMPDNDGAQVGAATALMSRGLFEDARTRILKVVARSPSNVEAQIILGNALAGLKDLDGAVREMEEAIALEPGRATTYSNLAALKLAQGNKEQAKAAFEKAVSVDPRSIPAWLALAQFQWFTGDAATAERSLKRALDVDPKHPLVNRALATFYTGSNRIAEAEPYLKTLAATGGSAAAMQLADYYIAARRTGDAKAVLEALSKDAASAGAGETRLAAIAYAENDGAGGHQRVDALLKRQPNNVAAMLLKAQFLGIENKTSEAEAMAQAAVKADPRSTAAHYKLGTLQALLRKPKEAIASFSEVLRLNPKATAAQVYLSRLTLLEGTPDAAVTFAEGALSTAPANPAARIGLVRGLLGRRDFDRAETELAPLLKQYPQASEVHAVQGMLRIQKRDLIGARASYEKALSLSSASLEALTGLVTVDLLEKKAPQARARIEARLAVEPDRPEYLVLAGQVYGAQRDFAKAESALRRAIQVAPATSSAYPMLANVLFVSGKLDAARVEFDQMAQRDAKNIGARTMAAMIVHAQDKTEDARKRYEGILAADPNAVIAANNLAWIYAEEGQKLDEALKLAQSAARRLPETPEVQDTLGWVYYKQALPALAVPLFEKSVEKAPDNALYQYHLALALSKAGDIQRARGVAEQAVKLKPDYVEARELLASLKG